MFDTLKAVICHPEQPYLVKRAYLRLLFEVFINKIPDPKIKVDNENVDSEEISEILNSEIIPQVILIMFTLQFFFFFFFFLEKEYYLYMHIYTKIMKY